MMNDLRSARNVTSYTLFIFIEELVGRKVSAQHTVHPKNYANGSHIIVISHGVFQIYSIDILQVYSTDNGAILLWPQWEWNNPEECG